MKNTVSPEPKPVLKKARVEVEPVRVSDMGMGIKASNKEVEKKQPATAAV